MNDPNPFGPLLQFLQDEIDKEMTEKERQMKAVVDRIAAMDRRQRFTAQEAALGGYILGYRDRHDGRKDTSNASIVARVISMALFDDELPFEVLAGTKLGDDECDKGDEPAAKCHFCGAEYFESQVDSKGSTRREVDENCGIDRIQVEVELPCGHVERRLRVSDEQ